jgi:hypothetical protein
MLTSRTPLAQVQYQYKIQIVPWPVACLYNVKLKVLCGPTITKKIYKIDSNNRYVFGDWVLDITYFLSLKCFSRVQDGVPLKFKDNFKHHKTEKYLYFFKF